MQNVESNGIVFDYVCNHQKNSTQVLLAAAKQDGLPLQYASPNSQKTDKSIDIAKAIF